jgi:hypothetical protein
MQFEADSTGGLFDVEEMASTGERCVGNRVLIIWLGLHYI